MGATDHPMIRHGRRAWLDFAERGMVTFLDLVARAGLSRVTHHGRSSKWSAIEAGLKCNCRANCPLTDQPLKSGEARVPEQARLCNALWCRRGGDRP